MSNEFYKKIGKGKNILFLHGWGENKNTWLPVIDYLKEDFTCLAVDLPAFGVNSATTSILTPMDYAMWLKNFILDKKIVDYYLVGHSFGGRIAICLANIDTNRIRSLVLYSTPGFRENIAFVPRVIAHLYNLFGLKRFPFFKKNKISRRLLTNLYSDDYKNSYGQLRKIFLATINYDLTKQMEQINIPTNIIIGERDEIVSVATAKKMQTIIKNSQLRVVSLGSHFMHIENPLLFSGTLINFFNEK